MQDNPLWKYSLAVYSKAGVASVLLQLQDDFGADINMLLGCCWLAADGRVLTDEDLLALITSSAKWRAECIVPLRSVRRFLKSRQQFTSMYEQVKFLEIEAEQWQQEQMFQQLSMSDLSLSQQPADELALQNLQRYSVYLPGVDWKDIAGLTSELVVAIGHLTQRD